MVDEALLAGVAEEGQTEPDVVLRVLEALAAAVRKRVDAGRSVALPGIGVLSSGPLQDVRFEVDGALQRDVSAEPPVWWDEPRHQRARRLARTIVADVTLYCPEQAPRLAVTMADAAIHARCARALGAHWSEARRTIEARVDAETRDQHDHLADAARSAWAAG